MITRLLLALVIAIVGYGINERLIQVVSVESQRLSVEIAQHELIRAVILPYERQELDRPGVFLEEDCHGPAT